MSTEQPLPQRNWRYYGNVPGVAVNLTNQQLLQFDLPGAYREHRIYAHYRYNHVGTAVWNARVQLWSNGRPIYDCPFVESVRNSRPGADANSTSAQFAFFVAADVSGLSTIPWAPEAPAVALVAPGGYGSFAEKKYVLLPRRFNGRADRLSIEVSRAVIDELQLFIGVESLP